MDTILPYLAGRNWRVLIAPEPSGHFITSDNPVLLHWNEPDKVPAMHRHSPEFGLKHTPVQIAVNKKVTLLGSFVYPSGVFDAESHQVAHLNSLVAGRAYD